jgi:hypothetical protein
MLTGTREVRLRLDLRRLTITRVRSTEMVLTADWQECQKLVLHIKAIPLLSFAFS